MNGKPPQEASSRRRRDPPRKRRLTDCHMGSSGEHHPFLAWAIKGLMFKRRTETLQQTDQSPTPIAARKASRRRARLLPARRHDRAKRDSGCHRKVEPRVRRRGHPQAMIPTGPN